MSERSELIISTGHGEALRAEQFTGAPEVAALPGWSSAVAGAPVIGPVVGLDLGSRRIGVAVSDRGRVLATPRATIERGRGRIDDHRRIAEVVADADATAVVVGLPLSLDGSRGPAARDVEAEVEELRDVLDVPVVVHDERLTTVAATRGQRARGVRAKEGRRTVDQQAAAVLLQSWLDGQAVGDA